MTFRKSSRPNERSQGEPFIDENCMSGWASVQIAVYVRPDGSPGHREIYYSEARDVNRSLARATPC